MKRTALLILSIAATSAMAGPGATPKQVFEKLKKLSGTWESIESGQGYKVVYKVTGGGSAVVETQFPGTSHEMVTVYHMDRDALVMTHYCAAGNQPTMKYRPVKDSEWLAFDFLRGSNMKLSDMHMHSMKLRFVSDDHIMSDWLSYSGGKPSDKVRFDMKRTGK